jgi:DNA-binding MarR family transcriptional regulator
VANSVNQPAQAPVHEETLADLDAALLGLRHLWSGHPHRHVAHDGAVPVELSTVWIVTALTHAEAEGQGSVSVRELAGALDVAQSTASRLIDRAEAAAMVTRHRDPQDARRVLCTATDEGRLLARRSLTFRIAYLAGLTRDWAPADRTAFTRLLTRFVTAAHDRPPTEEPA